MKSIKLKITVSIILCSLLTTSFIGLISMSDIRRISNEAAENELTLNSELTASEMQAQLSRVEQSVNTLTSIALHNLDVSKFKTDSKYVTDYTNDLLDEVTQIGINTEGAISVYIRYNPDFTEPTSGIFLNRSNTQSDFDSLEPTDFSMYDKYKLVGITIYTTDKLEDYYGEVIAELKELDEDLIEELTKPVLLKNKVIFEIEEGNWTWKSPD